MNATALGTLYDLSQPLRSDMPQWPGPSFAVCLYKRHGDGPTLEGRSMATEIVMMRGHHGTHIDALSHIAIDGRLFGGVEASACETPSGMRVLGAETIPLLVCRYVLLDIARAREVDRLAPAQRIGAGDLEDACRRADVFPGAGDVVLVRTGWGSLWGSPGEYMPAGGMPGLDESAGTWLAARNVRAIGSDTAVVERFHHETARTLPLHGLCLAEKGIYLIENLDLEDLGRARAVAGMFIALPLRLEGATASPIRAVALVDRA